MSLYARLGVLLMLVGLLPLGHIRDAQAQAVVLDCRDAMGGQVSATVAFTIKLDYEASTVTYVSSGTTSRITVTDSEITWPGRRNGEVNTLNRYTLELTEYRPTGVPRNWKYACQQGGRRI